MALSKYSNAKMPPGKSLRAASMEARTSALANAARKRVFGWRRKVATGAAGALAVAMAYGVVFGHNGLTVFAHKRSETADLQRQMQLLQKENERLRGRVDHLQNDPGAIEHEAREDLHYTRAGEVIVTMRPKPATQTPVPPAVR